VRKDASAWMLPRRIRVPRRPAWAGNSGEAAGAGGMVLQRAYWLEAEQPNALPKSPLGIAINYVQNNWEALSQYASSGYLAIDNNVAEQQMKKIATGRNYAQSPIMQSPTPSHARQCCQDAAGLRIIPSILGGSRRRPGATEKRHWRVIPSSILGY
jgi:hypothetical protein